MRPNRNASRRTEEEGNQRVKNFLKKLKGNYVGANLLFGYLRVTYLLFLVL